MELLEHLHLVFQTGEVLELVLDLQVLDFLLDLIQVQLLVLQPKHGIQVSPSPLLDPGAVVGI
jgi:hypothetical protein